VSAAAETAAAFAGAGTALQTVRDLLRFAVSRFQEAALTFGHGTDNAFDEAAYLILHTLHLPLDRLEPFLDARLLPEEVDEILGVLSRRVHERLPAAYITREAWLADHRFYVDERVIVPRSHIAELVSERFAAWLPDRTAFPAPSTCAPGPAAWRWFSRTHSPMHRSTPATCRRRRWRLRGATSRTMASKGASSCSSRICLRDLAGASTTSS
jgi:hypothetical protein